MNPWIAMALISVAFAGLFGLFCSLRRSGRIHPELSRKGVHVGMGLVTLGFPWIFREPWPVLILSGVFTVLLLGVRCSPTLRRGLGNVLSDVDRSSWGELYFVLAVLLMFLLSAHHPVFYAIPLLILTLADAAAAIAGVFFGRKPYVASDGIKTWEGTTLFFVLALVSSSLTLGLTGTMSWESAALSGLCIGLLSTMIEAGSWRGLDNLLLPLSILAMLRIYALETPDGLWLRIAVLALLIASFVPLRRYVLLYEGPLLGALVLVYLCWAFGGWRWVIGPLTLLIAHPFFLRANPNPPALMRHTHPALLSTGAPALGWLMLSRSVDRPEWLLPFSMTVCAQLAMSALALGFGGPRRGRLAWSRPFTIGLLAWLAVLGPAWWLTRPHPSPFAAWIESLALAISIAYAFDRMLPHLEARTSPTQYWSWRALLATASSFPLALWISTWPPNLPAR